MSGSWAIALTTIPYLVLYRRNTRNVTAKDASIIMKTLYDGILIPSNEMGTRRYLGLPIFRNIVPQTILIASDRRYTKANISKNWYRCSRRYTRLIRITSRDPPIKAKIMGPTTKDISKCPDMVTMERDKE
jgi:hypothetical protein